MEAAGAFSGEGTAGRIFLAFAGVAAGVGLSTRRAGHVLPLSVRGATVDKVARQLHLTRGTVRNHLSIAIQNSTPATG